MQARPTLSIVITCYNYEKYVGEAIESVLKQANDGIELIVVDDGSKDGSRAVIEQYLEEKNFKFIAKENGGQASAFNAGIRTSRGKWVWFLDADDTICEEGFPSIYSNLARIEASKIHFRMKSFGKKENLIPRPNYQLSRGDCSMEIFQNTYVTMPTSGNIYLRKFLEQIYPVDEALFRICADVFLNMKAPFYGKICALETVGANYRIHGKNNFSGKSNNLSSLESSCERHIARAIYLEEMARAKGLRFTRKGFLSPSEIAELYELQLRSGKRHTITGNFTFIGSAILIVRNPRIAMRSKLKMLIKLTKTRIIF